MASRSTTETPIGTEKVQWAKPLHIQRLERALRLDPFLDYVQQVLSNPVSDLDDTTETEGEIVSDETNDRKTLNGVPASRQERRSSKMCLFNFSKVKKTRRWLKSILLSDSSESEEDHDLTHTEENIQHMLYFHRLKKAARTEFLSDPEIRQYQYYSVGLLSNQDKYQEQQNLVVGGKKKLKEKKTITKKKATKLKKNKSEKLEKKMDHQGYILPYELHEAAETASSSKDGKLRQKSSEDGQKEPTSQKSHSKKKSAANHDAVMAMKRRRLWTALAKKEISRAQKQRVNAHKEVLTMTRRLAHVCQRECRKAALLSQKVMKDTPSRARRLTREMLLYWKRYDKIEKEHRKRAEKEAQEQMRMDIELREAKRQQRKLNFLITQTELYAHFMSKKVSGVQKDEKQKEILSQLDEDTTGSVTRNPMLNIEEDDYNSEEAKAKALQTAEEAYKAHQSKTKAFDSEILQVLKNDTGDLNKNFRLTNPSLSTDSDLPQPRMFVGKLKSYQLKGMNWLHNLYDKGINGILADEMGLGKTVQTIALLATLAEIEGVWGPFLIIAPASTLHNWQQEFTKFIPKFKVLPYWGNTSDRKILRKFWSQKDLHTERASFHVLITSYQLVVQDVKYFQRVKWQYLVLDEAQAIKSTSSVRWKILLGFNCRNRLLLTGTPIQNSMAELWALLHFIMPTLFDSHEEFNEWFSKDIESHAENKSGIDERHLSRLHMILKPFMLRRIKKDVENELSDKIEILVYCQLTERQKLLYRSLKNKISIEDLMQSSSSTPSQAQSVTSSLLNLVMQFRKVCNHPDLFERREPKSSFRMQLDPYILPKLLFREGKLLKCRCYVESV
ncbi:DNA helicase INO80-like [Limulus polyphemus]|uniref:Chromatin-remodeling ATPase INO80 n=1 Tax=Limulus polyphemus TaxID=6850 RepID=A0ABM1BT86_LIMPO|nr:DNA helicase INO80-like [Limulus polyphemus]